MDFWRRALADWSRPDVPIERDPFLVVGALVIGVLAQWSDPGNMAELLGMGVAVATCAVVGAGAGERVPLGLFAALVTIPVTVVVARDGNLEGSLFLPVLVTLYVSWHSGSTVRAGLAAAAAAISPILVAEVLSHDSNIEWTPWTTANVFTLAMGFTLRRQRTLIEELRAAREALADQAVAEERRRIARELHDLAGHTLAAMMLHVTGARHVLSRDPADAARALQDAERVGRDSLDQIRATVAALRTDERGTDAALAGSAELEPLIEAYRRAGLKVDLAVDTAAAQVEGPVGTAVHRIVQEALANVARHAPGNDVTVSVTGAAGTVVVAVTDSGQRPAALDATAGHFGLVGMRERARALGGDLTAGPHERGWRVRATLPTPDGTDTVEAS